MTHRATTRTVAATALAVGTLALLSAGTANADPRTLDWWDGNSHFTRTISNETPAVGETLTVTTKFERGSEEKLDWVKDHHPTCLTYVYDSAKMNGKPVEPHLDIKPDYIAGDLNAGAFTSDKVIVNEGKPAVFTAQYQVGADCSRGIALQTGMSYSGSLGTGTYTTNGPSLTVAKAASSIALSPITGATVGKTTTLTAKVTPAAAGGTITFKDDKKVIGTVYVGADGTATAQWAPAAHGQRTIIADFSGSADASASTTTATVTVAPEGGTNPGGAGSIGSLFGFGS
ncbi:Ig-like domain-containing protein [Rhodococcus tukisamuensis]|uniref:Ig-like domain (Group 3) n=1 Tax=Rhodococcus tukisamuensis TaxID=168276 RepID=A0A1G6W5I5_9NOCA|nr:Ig-like domain-containing protein [Rhodococcus tukisamuensis]SDD61099.1 Ig-like domain (group 3) [Rhodococcus tukisamuensis]